MTRLAKEEAGGLLTSLGDAAAFAQRALPSEDTSFVWSPVGSGVTADATATLEKPSPTPVCFQTSGGPCLGQARSKPWSLEISSRFGPRNCGQLSARASIAMHGMSAAAIAHARASRDAMLATRGVRRAQ